MEYEILWQLLVEVWGMCMCVYVFMVLSALTQNILFSSFNVCLESVNFLSSCFSMKYIFLRTEWKSGWVKFSCWDIQNSLSVFFKTIAHHNLWTSSIASDTFAINLKDAYFYVIFFFCIADFNILSLSLFLIIITRVCLVLFY